MCSAQRVIQGWRSSYRTKAVTFDSLTALACCFFRLDFSMCPVLVGAGNTQGDDDSPWRLDSTTAATRSDRGITRRALSVLPRSKSTRLNSSHANISYAVFFLEKKYITVQCVGV